MTLPPIDFPPVTHAVVDEARRLARMGGRPRPVGGAGEMAATVATGGWGTGDAAGGGRTAEPATRT